MECGFSLQRVIVLYKCELMLFPTIFSRLLGGSPCIGNTGMLRFAAFC